MLQVLGIFCPVACRSVVFARNREVLHKDLNIGNILYKDDGRGGYVFQLMDTNRMRFHRVLSMRQRLDNLRRLSCPVPAYLIFLSDML